MGVMVWTDQHPRGYLLGGPDDPDRELRPSFTTIAGIAVCDRCGGGTGCELSLYGLAWAETEHALAGCSGTMRLTTDGKTAVDPIELRVGPPLPAPDYDLFEKVRK